MKIPPDFSFSQNNLQDFVECPRRFELRYLLRQPWPAIQSQPVLEHEQHLRRGEIFHQMVQQHQIGLPVEKIAAQAYDQTLLGWWEDYLGSQPSPLPERRFVEHTLQTTYGNYRLIAKFDLIAIQPAEKIIIVDWKTGRRKPPRGVLARRIQTRLYPFLLWKCANALDKTSTYTPEQIEMIYWFTADPLSPEHFHYSYKQAERDGEYILELIQQVEHYAKTYFPLTSQEQHCSICVYRSLCNRGITAGSAEDEMDEEIDDDRLDIAFDQIGETEF
ncbi:MAG: PD-(D/E)XK nuclease family protein [Chloroflexota bacterium]|nr:MAG: hypothetical protein KatS3mg047_0483 [Bellilinea sp.]